MNSWKQKIIVGKENVTNEFFKIDDPPNPGNRGNALLKGWPSVLVGVLAAPTMGGSGRKCWGGSGRKGRDGAK